MYILGLGKFLHRDFPPKNTVTLSPMNATTCCDWQKSVTARCHPPSPGSKRRHPISPATSVSVVLSLTPGAHARSGNPPETDAMEPTPPLGPLGADAGTRQELGAKPGQGPQAVSYTHLRAHETPEPLVCRL